MSGSDTGFEAVTVVGAGLIGGSAALRLAALGRPVTVVDPDPATRTAAEAAGLETRERTPADADLVLVAAPLDVLPAVLADVAARARTAVVVDVGSVKAAPARAAEAAGLTGRYVGAHPMAGTEHSGFDAASADLLVGARWAVTRGPGPVADVADWITAAFDAEVLVLDEAEHDRAVALISHLPHTLANAVLELVRGADVPAALPLAAGSFRDVTRVAGTNPVRTGNMLLENADALGPVLDDLIDLLTAYRRDLADPGALRRRLAALADPSEVRPG